ncbi:putative quinol monooxygenase [Pseudonocardia sp. TRM90224]|uniref:putative quinol monooxygenase n=1 Tax=Pseudonocardia sp. TRM90224 TaxID=2812678 RepID=UPI001E29880F|nr:antibiotic biosynthesis monooxygenase [Pseudonocardia sp. TRM90224]
MYFGYNGTMRTRPGRRDEVVTLLLSGLEHPAVGCLSYVVGTDDEDADLIHVTEVWLSEQHHDDSLTLPETKDAIARAMPMLTGEFTSTRITVLGGVGLEVGNA